MLDSTSYRSHWGQQCFSITMPWLQDLRICSFTSLLGSFAFSKHITTLLILWCCCKHDISFPLFFFKALFANNLASKMLQHSVKCKTNTKSSYLQTVFLSNSFTKWSMSHALECCMHSCVEQSGEHWSILACEQLSISRKPLSHSAKTLLPVTFHLSM